MSQPKKSAIQSLAQRSAKLIVGDVLSGVCATVTAVILARELGPESYGIWVFVISVATLLPFLVSMRTHFMMTKALVNHRDEPETLRQHFQFLHSTNLLCYGTAVVALFVAGATARFFLEPSAIYELLFFIVAATGFFRSLDSAWISVTRNEKHFYLLAAAQLLYSLPLLVWVVVCKFFFSMSLPLLAAGYLGGIALSWLFRFLYIRKTLKVQYGIAIQWFNPLEHFKLKPRLGDLWQESLPIYYGNMFETLPQNVDTVLLGLFQSSAAVGIYRTATVLIRAVGKLVKPLNRVLFQDFAALLKQDKEATLRKAISSYLAVVGPLLFLAFCTLSYFMKEVVLFVYGEEYLASVNSMLLLLPGIYFSFLLFWTKTYSIAKGLSSDFQKSMAVAAISFLVLGSFAAKQFGPPGVAAVSSAAMILQNCWLAIKIWRTPVR